MRKQFKSLIVAGLTAAMVVTSVPGIQFTTAKAASEPVYVDKSTTANVEVPDAPLNFKDLSSDEIIKACGLGWNLGNTMDAWGYVKGTKNDFITGETMWQKVETTKSLIKSVHDLGFNTIRIPVTWGANIKEDYEVSEDWMSRVQEIVDYAISQDMYVELNMHHDGCLQSDPKGADPHPHGWFDLSVSEDEYAQVRERYDGLWKTIANRFKNYDEHLMFGAMNEVYYAAEYDGEGNLGWVPQYGYQNEEVQSEWMKLETNRINEINQDFVDIVRNSGGNNAKRWVVVQPHNTQIEALTNEPFASMFKLPNDPAKRTMIEVHDYSALDGANEFDETNSKKYAGRWSELKKKYVDKGVPVVIGEYGWVGKGEKRRFSFEGIGYLLKKYSMIGCVWDEGGTDTKAYAVIDRTSQTALDTGISALVNGYNNITDTSKIVKKSTSIPITDLSVDKDTVELTAGETTTVTAKATAPEDTNDAIAWGTSDDTVATVYNGVIVAKAPGKATITAKAIAGTASKEIEVTVKAASYENPTTEITTEKKNVTLRIGQETYLNAAVAPAGNGADLIYRCADESIVTVSSDGRILAKKIGDTTITAVTSDGVEKEIPVSVLDSDVPVNYVLHLAIHAFYNFNGDKGYYGGTEISSDVITVTGDGTYTITFDCAKDLSQKAKDAGVTSLNGLGSLYIRDYDVTSGKEKKSPKDGDGKLCYTSIKVDGKEMLTEDTAPQSAMKGGIFDTGNPLNVWDGSVLGDDKIEVVKAGDGGNSIQFKDMESPQVIEITFKMDGFHTPEASEEPSVAPSEEPSGVPSAVAPATQIPAVSNSPAATVTPTGTSIAVPSTVPSAEPSKTPSNTNTVKKGETVKVSGTSYKVTDVKKKTVEYKAPVNKKKTSVTVPKTVKIKGASYKVTSVAKNAFKNNKKLKKVVIGENITKVNANAFAGCKSLKNVTIKSKSLKSVGKNAFKGINKKAVFKVPAKKLKAYKKLLNSKAGIKKSMKIKK